MDIHGRIKELINLNGISLYKICQTNNKTEHKAPFLFFINKRTQVVMFNLRS